MITFKQRLKLKLKSTHCNQWLVIAGLCVTLAATLSFLISLL